MNSKNKQNTEQYIDDTTNFYNSPEELYLQKDFRESVLKAINTLEDMDRYYILERFYNGKTLQEIGEMDGVTDVAAGKRMQRILQTIQDRLKGEKVN